MLETLLQIDHICLSFTGTLDLKAVGQAPWHGTLRFQKVILLGQVQFPLGNPAILHTLPNRACEGGRVGGGQALYRVHCSCHMPVAVLTSPWALIKPCRDLFSREGEGGGGVVLFILGSCNAHPDLCFNHREPPYASATSPSRQRQARTNPTVQPA